MSIAAKAKWLAFGWLLLVLPLGVQGAVTPPVEPYSGASLVRESEVQTDDYALPLGSWRRVSGDWRIDRSERLTGTLGRFTYRLPEGRSPGAAHRHWLTALQPLSPKILFSCRGRACGPSNQWANAVFDNRELYGLDGKQWFDAIEVEHEGRRLALAIYTVERGNRRIYTHLDQLVLDAGQRQELPVTADGILVPLREQGQLVLTTEDSISEHQLDALTLALQKDVSLKVNVVAHAYGPESLAILQARSQQRAERIALALVAAGIPPARVQPIGVGPAAPGNTGRVDRIELVRADAKQRSNQR